MKNSDDWLLRFQAYLEGLGYKQSTIKGHVQWLTSWTVRYHLELYFNSTPIQLLDPKTALYNLQAHICLDGLKSWRDIWTAIDHLRNWELQNDTSDTDAEALKETIDCIIEARQTICKETQKVLSEFKRQNNKHIPLLTEEKQEPTTSELIIWQNNLFMMEKELTKREAELHAKEISLKKLMTKAIEGPHISKKRKKAPLNCIRSTYNGDIEWVKQKAKELHKNENLGTSNRLLYMMIAMRDCGILREDVKDTTFLQLLILWKILDDKTLNIENARSNMSHLKKSLPDDGRPSIFSGKWDEKQYSDIWEYCKKLTKYFEK